VPYLKHEIRQAIKFPAFLPTRPFSVSFLQVRYLILIISLFSFGNAFLFQDFISNFVLTEEAFAVYDKKMEEKNSEKNSSSSIFGDVLLFSGSIAAVAGTILYLSERTR
jgi:hypothetical protein